MANAFIIFFLVSFGLCACSRVREIKGFLTRNNYRKVKRPPKVRPKI